MFDSIEAYVEDLQSLLRGKLPADRVDGILKEADSHLHESVQLKIGPTVDETCGAKRPPSAMRTAESCLGVLAGIAQETLGSKPGVVGRHRRRSHNLLLDFSLADS